HLGSCRCYRRRVGRGFDPPAKTHHVLTENKENILIKGEMMTNITYNSNQRKESATAMKETMRQHLAKRCGTIGK
ncbi:MAG: hypothetical protein R6X34_10695, partial [Chloroflexota bacterium]